LSKHAICSFRWIRSFRFEARKHPQAHEPSPRRAAYTGHRVGIGSFYMPSSRPSCSPPRASKLPLQSNLRPDRARGFLYLYTTLASTLHFNWPLPAYVYQQQRWYHPSYPTPIFQLGISCSFNLANIVNAKATLHTVAFILGALTAGGGLTGYVRQPSKPPKQNPRR